jgi:CHAD domain-containing protein
LRGDQKEARLNRVALRLQSEIRSALERLRAARLTDESIHEARKALKKARAGLRLLRPGLGEARFRAENAALRDAGRHLSAARDPVSVAEALASLRSKHADEMRGAGLARVSEALQADKARARREIRAHAALQDCIMQLERSLARAERPEISGIASSCLAQGLARIYRKGRKAFARAAEDGSPEALHEWRKQVKYLLHATEMLKGSGHAKAAKVVRRADKVAYRLGDDHDLVVLAKRAPAQKKLRKLIEARRAKLRKKSFALGKKLYDRKPGRFLGALA